MDYNRSLHTFHTACHVKNLLQPYYLDSDITKDQFKTIAKKVTTKFLDQFTENELKKSLLFSPKRMFRVKQLVDEELNHFISQS